MKHTQSRIAQHVIASAGRQKGSLHMREAIQSVILPAFVNVRIVFLVNVSNLSSPMQYAHTASDDFTVWIASRFYKLPIHLLALAMTGLAFLIGGVSLHSLSTTL